jgi:hypothetical protein
MASTSHRTGDLPGAPAPRASARRLLGLLCLALCAGLLPVPAAGQARLADEELPVLRLCRVLNSGYVYCHDLAPALEALRERGVEVELPVLRELFAHLYEDHRLDPSANTLIDCGGAGITAVRLRMGGGPATQAEAVVAKEACLGKLRGMLARDAIELPAPGSDPFTFTVARGRQGAAEAFGRRCGPPADPTIATYSEPEPNTIEWFELQAKRARKKAQFAEEGHDYIDGHDSDYWHAKADAYKAAAEFLRQEQGEPPPAGEDTERPSDDGMTCEELEAEIAAFFAECDRNGWSTYECQKLASTCGDPALAIVDPEGITCRGIDVIGGEEPLKQALLHACESRVRYGPDGGSPCEGLEPGMPMRSLLGPVCGDPLALVLEPCVTVPFSAVGPTLVGELAKWHERMGSPPLPDELFGGTPGESFPSECERCWGSNLGSGI